jgi:transcriptional regulator with XRE-family HTH domain
MPSLSEVHAAFGNAIRQLRKERGMSQEGFALKSGINRGYFGDVERGERNVSLANILKIADALNVPPSEIHVRAETLLASKRSSTASRRSA